MSDQREPRVIKRYANRKLYDMSESCYITHEEIAVLVRNGEEVRIIDNRTQEDLTSATLTQILLDEEKRVKRPLPIDTLRNFFQSGGDFIQRKIKQPVANLRDEADKNLRRVFGRREDGAEPLPGAAKVEPVEPPPPPAAATATAKPKTADALREAIEDRWLEIQHAFQQLDYPKRIAELERRVQTLEAALSALRGVPIEGAFDEDVLDISGQAANDEDHN